MKRVLMLLLGILMLAASAVGDVTSGLVAWYKFDGNLNDASGNGYDMAGTCGGYVHGQGLAGQALSCAGLTAVCPAKRIEVESSFTISCWLKADEDIAVVAESSSGIKTNGKMVLTPGQCGTYGAGGGAGIGFAYGKNGVAVYEHGASYLPVVLMHSANVGTGWNHVVITVSNDNAPMLYINGDFVRQGVKGARTHRCVMLGKDCSTIGGEFYNNRFNGCVDDFRIYNRAFSATEARALYDYNAGMPIVTQYIVTFNSNGGTPTPVAIVRNEGESYGVLPTVTRSGHAFDGWYTSANGGSKVSAATVASADRTLYAHWERYAYDFKWLGGGKLDICAGTRRTDEAQGIAMDSAWGNGGTRAVVSVDGVEKAESRGADEFVWSGDETKEYTLKHQVYDAQGRAVGEPYVAKIAWTSRAAVMFDGGNGEEAFSREYDKSYAYGELPSVTKTGHTFAGWYTAAEGGEKVEAGAQFDGSVSKLYAHWTVNQYGVKFDKNGGEGTAGDLTVAYGDVVPMDGVAFRKSGYRLAGWATAADGAAVYGQGGAMSNLTAEANGSVQLYAVWEPTTVDLKSFKQRYPWNGFVDVECDVGAEGRVGLMLIDEASGTNFTAKTLFCQGGSVTNSALWMAEGPQKFIWDAGSDLPDGFKTSKLKAKTYFVEGEE